MQTQLSLFGSDTLEDEFQSLMRMVPAAECDYVTHQIHPYPAKFLPHFPRLFIRHFSGEGDLVVDPMCGSGTTLAEACLMSRRAYGIDIDPIGALISRVSVTPLSEQMLRAYEGELVKDIQQRIGRGEAADIELPTTEDFPNFSLWFRVDVLKELLLIRDAILASNAEEDLREFAQLCLSAIVKPVSNADPRDIFPERDQEHPVRERRDVVAEYRRAFHDNCSRVVEFSTQVHGERRGQAILGDARSIGLDDGVAKLVFTSPPYAYAMDYARVHQLSTLLFIMGNQELREHRRRYVGTDRVSVNDQLLSFEGIEFAQNEIKAVHEKNRKLGVILYRYFTDMYKVTEECARVLQPGGHLIYVVGNSTVRGTAFGTDDVFASMCEQVGLEVVDRLERPYYAYRMSRKRNLQSNTIKADVFIIAKKTEQHADSR